jgi:protein TonB
MANKALLFDDEVFENRNKAYGAYFLRRVYEHNVLIGFLVAASIISLGLAAPVIYKSWFATSSTEEETRIVTVQMENIQTEIEEPEVKVEKELPKAATVKSLPPEVKPDEQVKKEELPPTEDELKDKNPGAENQEGEKTTTVTAPSNPAPEPQLEEVKIETWAEQMPIFPGGPSEFIKYLQRHIEYPDRAKSEDVQGTVRVSFVVNQDGSISEVKIVKGVGYGLDEEALRVFKKMPKWNPGVKKGMIVPVRMVYPVVFQLETE